MADTHVAQCATCNDRTWIDVKPDQITLFQRRWPFARFLPGLNDCPVCIQAKASDAKPPQT